MLSGPLPGPPLGQPLAYPVLLCAGLAPDVVRDGWSSTYDTDAEEPGLVPSFLGDPALQLFPLRSLVPLLFVGSACLFLSFDLFWCRLYPRLWQGEGELESMAYCPLVRLQDASPSPQTGQIGPRCSPGHQTPWKWPVSRTAPPSGASEGSSDHPQGDAPTPEESGLWTAQRLAWTSSA